MVHNVSMKSKRYLPVTISLISVGNGGIQFHMNRDMETVWYYVPGGINRRSGITKHRSVYFPGQYNIEECKAALLAAPLINELTPIIWDEATVTYTLRYYKLLTRQNKTRFTKRTVGQRTSNINREWTCI